MTKNRVQYETAYIRMRTLLSEGDPSAEAKTTRFLDAKELIEKYELAVDRREALPSREAIAEAAFWLLFHTGLKQDSSKLKLVALLMTPEIGVSMYDIMPSVVALKNKATTLAESEIAEADELTPLVVKPRIIPDFF